MGVGPRRVQVHRSAGGPDSFVLALWTECDVARAAERVRKHALARMHSFKNCLHRSLRTFRGVVPIALRDDGVSRCGGQNAPFGRSADTRSLLVLFACRLRGIRHLPWCPRLDGAEEEPGQSSASGPRCWRRGAGRLAFGLQRLGELGRFRMRSRCRCDKRPRRTIERL